MIYLLYLNLNVKNVSLLRIIMTVYLHVYICDPYKSFIFATWQKSTVSLEKISLL